MNEANIRCENVPDVVKDVPKKRLTEHGKSVRSFWDQTCKGNANAPQTYSFSCYTGGSQTMLWDSNYNAASYGTKITPQFNLPWDVACCCCGGGTAKNKPGEKMRFKPESTYEDIAVKLTSPAADADWSSFVEGTELPLLNTKKHKDWKKVLYPRYKPAMVQSGLLYTFPLKTYKQAEANPYPFAPSSGEECQDYELNKDIVNSTIHYRSVPQQWAGWAGYTCRFYYYNKACDAKGVQSPTSLSQFGGREQYFNGMIKESIVDSWVFEKPVKTSTQGKRLADPFKVCCACGGGRKKTGAAPATIVDVLADDYYVKPS